MKRTDSVRSRMCSVFAASIALALVSTTAGTAQPNSTALTIRVEDPLNRPVPKAGVKVVAADGPWRTESVTTEDGESRFLMLPGGLYHVEVLAPGFEPWTHRITTSAATTTRVTVTLTLRPQREAIIVTETLSGPATGSPNRVLDRAETASLPLNRRHVLDFVMLSSPANRDSLQVLAAAATSGLSMAGNRPRTNSLSLDGITMNDEVSGAFRSQIPVDAVQEVQIRAGEFDIEQGRRLGGAVQITTRSGTNELHGAAFGLLRNRVLDATSALTPVKNPANTRAQFGANLGGTLQRDQTFFFLAMEGLRQQASIFHRIGLDQDLFGLSADQQQLADDSFMTPYLRLASRGAEIAKSGRDPAGQPLSYRLTPLGDLANSSPRRSRGAAYSARVDRLAWNRHRLMARANFGETDDTGVEAQNNDQARGLANAERYTRVRVLDPTFALGLTSAWSSSSVMDLRMGWSRRTFEILPTSSTTSANLSGVAFLGQEPFSPVRRSEQQWQLSQVVSWDRGETPIRFGGDLLVAPVVMDFARRSNGLFLFGERPAPMFPSAPPLTVVQAYGLGLPLQFVQEIGSTRAETGKTSFGLFGTMRKQVGERWTAEFGIRYDQERPHGEPQRLPESVEYVYDALNAVQVPRADLNGWQPRVGLAYRLRRDGGLAIRAAYSLHNDRLITHPLWAAQVQNGATVKQMTLVGPAAIQVFQSASQQLSPPIPDGSPSGLLAYDANWRIGYSQNALVALESRIGRTGKFNVRYLAMRGTALGRARDRNMPNSVRATAYLASGGSTLELFTRNYFRPLSAASEVMTIEGAARSSYHSLSIEYGASWDRLWWNGSYTWSKAIDDADDIFPLTRAQDQGNFRAERGLSLFDQRHRMVNSLNWQTASDAEGWKRLLTDWSASGTVEVSSGQPYSVILGFDNNLDQFPSSDRPDVIGSSGSQSYVAPAQGRSGNLGRNTSVGPAFASASVRLTRSFHLAESITALVSAEAFNVLNRTNVRSVNTNFRNAGQPLTAFDPRQVQIGMRVQF